MGRMELGKAGNSQITARRRKPARREILPVISPPPVALRTIARIMEIPAAPTVMVRLVCLAQPAAMGATSKTLDSPVQTAAATALAANVPVGSAAPMGVISIRVVPCVKPTRIHNTDVRGERDAVKMSAFNIAIATALGRARAVTAHTVAGKAGRRRIIVLLPRPVLPVTQHATTRRTPAIASVLLGLVAMVVITTTPVANVAIMRNRSTPATGEPDAATM